MLFKPTRFMVQNSANITQFSSAVKEMRMEVD